MRREGVIEAISKRADVVDEAQSALVFAVAAALAGDAEMGRVEDRALALQRAYRDSYPDMSTVIAHSRGLLGALQAAFDGRLECTECCCEKPCERLAALGVRPTDFGV